MRPPASTSHPPSPSGGLRSGSPLQRTEADDGRHSIHIIDDDAPLGAALTAGLEAFGFRAMFSTDANEAWTVAHVRRPDLILCDINMPGKNGHRFLQELRGDPALANCQFVFMTGNSVFAHPRAGMDLGADDFLLKPFTLETLVSCVSARLRRKEISARQEAAVVAELRASLHKSMPHEFFTPLNGILGYAEMLDQDLPGMAPGEVSKAVRGIIDSGQRLHRTLRNYLFTLDRLDPDSDAPFPVLSAASVGQLITRGAQAAVARHPDRRKDFTLAVNPTALSAGAQEVALLVEELVENAFDFSLPGTPVKVTAQRVGADLQLKVGDAGRGMTAQQVRENEAFRQFERPTYEQQGLGLGLFIVRQIIRRMGGRFQIQSQPGKGTLCIAALPTYAEPAGRGDH